MRSLKDIEMVIFGEELPMFKRKLFYYPEFRIMWEEIEGGYNHYAPLSLDKVAHKCRTRNGRSLKANRLNEHLASRNFDTFHVLLVKYRVYRAASIFLTIDEAVLKVAQAVGMDQSTLDRDFKKYLGMTPRAFRDECRRQAFGAA
jgi:AraC-like DNA-binding protein